MPDDILILQMQDMFDEDSVSDASSSERLAVFTLLAAEHRKDLDDEAFKALPDFFNRLEAAKEKLPKTEPGAPTPRLWEYADWVRAQKFPVAKWFGRHCQLPATKLSRIESAEQKLQQDAEKGAHNASGTGYRLFDPQIYGRVATELLSSDDLGESYIEGALNPSDDPKKELVEDTKVFAGLLLNDTGQLLDRIKASPSEVSQDVPEQISDINKVMDGLVIRLLEIDEAEAEKSLA